MGTATQAKAPLFTRSALVALIWPLFYSGAFYLVFCGILTILSSMNRICGMKNCWHVTQSSGRHW